MTPAERALLIAVAKHCRSDTAESYDALLIAIAAVEAEAAPPSGDIDGQGPNGPVLQDRVAAMPSEPEKSCPTCEGDGDIDDGSLAGKVCPDCDGTGRKK